jgi:hypothetical protein
VTDLSTDHGPDTRGGTAYGAGAYAIWDAFPLYFALLVPAGAWEILAHRNLRTLLFCAAVLAARREFAWCRSVFDNEDVPSPVELRWRPVDRQATLTKSSSLLLNQGTTTEMEPA